VLILRILQGANLYIPHSILGSSVNVYFKNGSSVKMKITAFSMNAHIKEEVELIYKGYDTEGLNREIDVKEIEVITIH
jgi:hypothetical protein